MPEFTSTLGLGRVTTDITLTATIIRTDIVIIGRIMVTPTIGLTIGTAAIVTTATTVIITTIGTKLTE
jgi:hypothetical protein